MTNDTGFEEGTIAKNLENSGLKSGSIVTNLALIFLVIILAIITIGVILLARKLAKDEKRKKKIQKMILKQKKAFMWNGMIGSVSISYLKNCIAVSA